MKLLSVIIFCIVAAPLARQQIEHASSTKPALQFVPQSTLHFKPASHGLPVSSEDAFIGYPFSSGDGTTYLDALLPPNDREQSLIAISPKGELSSYNLGALPDLVSITTLNIDAEDSNIYALVTAAKADVVRDHDVDPHSPDASQYAEYFILRFKEKLSAPDEIPLNVKFDAQRLAALSKDEFVILGFEPLNQIPVLAIVDDSGDVERYIDAYQDFGSNAAIIADAPQALKRQSRDSSKGEQLEFAVSASQFVHYRDSLLLLMPGPKPKVFTIRSGGAITSTILHLPAGFEADSLIPSNKYWFVRVKDGRSNIMNLVMIDPSSGDALRIIHSPELPAFDITCVHDGTYYGIQWAGPKGNERMFLIKSTQ